jgi:hypothetical protein
MKKKHFLKGHHWELRWERALSWNAPLSEGRFWSHIFKVMRSLNENFKIKSCLNPTVIVIGSAIEKLVLNNKIATVM